MKKQIIYAILIPRLFASTLDLALLSIISNPITTFISWKLSQYFFKVNIKEITIESLRGSELSQYISSSSLFWYILLISIINLLIVGSYFVGFWMRYSATPGKMIMRMKIVDAATLEKPTKLQFIKRFLGYITIPFGIWFVPFSKNHRALHDKLSGTAVIKN